MPEPRRANVLKSTQAWQRYWPAKHKSFNMRHQASDRRYNKMHGLWLYANTPQHRVPSM